MMQVIARGEDKSYLLNTITINKLSHEDTKKLVSDTIKGFIDIQERDTLKELVSSIMRGKKYSYGGYTFVYNSLLEEETED